jgi:hypothetical protein
MNTMLLQLIAAQASSNGNPGASEMMARLQAGSVADAGTDPKELLARLANSNPIVGALLKQMAEQQEAAARSSAVIDVDPIEQPAELPEHAGHSSDDSAAALEELRQLTESMRVELHLLRERNDLFAAALGACCHCWGQDLSCRSCRGRGGPGFSMPDESLFAEYIVPAIHTLQAQRTKFRKPSPDAPIRSVDRDTQIKQAANY